MKSRFPLAVASLLALAALTAPLAVADENELYQGPDLSVHPNGRGNRACHIPERGNSGTGNVVTGNGINYNGGPVMHGAVHVYFIWYGDWTQDTQANALDLLGLEHRRLPLYGSQHHLWGHQLPPATCPAS